ncbi:MAG TPA: VCBS repeat-containing protein [Gemmataceae bacterium]|nr:VCBS repeat-containing protein [Gemmataceae bacterium]
MTRKLGTVLLTALVPGAVLACALYLSCGKNSSSSKASDTPLEPVLSPVSTEAGDREVRQFCLYCHAFPEPDTFPRAHWRHEVAQAYDFWRNSGLSLDYPSLEGVVRYYESRAPLELPFVVPQTSKHPLPVQFKETSFRPPDQTRAPAVSNVNLVHLYDKRKLDILVCEMRSNQILVLSPYEPTPAWKVLAQVPNPAHAEVVDLDGDGIPDIVVACLGSFTPTDGRFGSVVWLRGAADGSFTPVTLLSGVGRVADVQAADFNGDGKLDLIVAVFGWRNTGEITYLENRTTDWTRPEFVPHVVDERHGTIHVPVCDLNGDGRPDFVALISQEHETIVAFLNEGNGKFRKEIIYAAPHPAYGSSGIQLVDLNGDGNLDVLYSNGDVMDKPFLFKPYHGIQWLENKGKFPFDHHPLGTMYGVARAVAADIRGKGLLDIVGVSWLPVENFPERDSKNVDSIILLEQTAPGQFERHVLESRTCDHITCAAGDIYGNGRMHFVTGNFYGTGKSPQSDAVQIWENRPRQHP